jgi:hypothetical protein
LYQTKKRKAIDFCCSTAIWHTRRGNAITLG